MKPRARRNKLGGWTATVKRGHSTFHGTGRTRKEAEEMALRFAKAGTRL